MIIGECPHCDKVTNTPMSDSYGFGALICPHCDEIYWQEYSRLQPVAHADISTLPEDVQELIRPNLPLDRKHILKADG